MTYTDLLTPEKWTPPKACGCGGPVKLKSKYLAGVWEVHIQPTLNKFKLFRSGNLVCVKPLTDLESTLTEYQL